MDPATYWRLRYLQAVSETALAQAAVAELRYREALREAGVDPAVAYRWDDSQPALVPVALAAGEDRHADHEPPVDGLASPAVASGPAAPAITEPMR